MHAICDNCTRRINNVNGGISIVTIGTKRMTVCTKCAKQLLALGYTEIARVK